MKIVQDKNEIPVDIANADIKPNPLGGYDLRCSDCGDRHHITDSDLMSAGPDKSVSSSVGSAFEIVAHGYPLVKGWNEIQIKAENGSVDFPEWRALEAQWNAKRNAWGFLLATKIATSLNLPCGHSISVTFGEDLSFAKEPDKVAMFLKLGIKTEKSERWMKYVYAGDAPMPSTYGKKKIEELTAFIKQLEDEKTAIIETSAKLLIELDAIHPLISNFKHVLTDTINANREQDIKNLRIAQLAELDKIDVVLQRVAIRG